MNGIVVIQARTILIGFQTQIGLFKFQLERKDFNIFPTFCKFFDLNKAQCVEKHPEFENLQKNPVRKQPEFQNLQKRKIRNHVPGVHYSAAPWERPPAPPGRGGPSHV